MFSNLKLMLGAGVSIVVFGFGMYLGHLIGARKVAGLEAQLESIRLAGSDADAKLKISRDEMAKTLKDKEDEYAKQARELQVASDQRAKDLATSLAGADGRIKSLTDQIAKNKASFAAERAKLVQQLGTAPAADKAVIQRQIDALDKRQQEEDKSAQAKVLGNQCLAAIVPEEVVRSVAALDAPGLKLTLALNGFGGSAAPVVAHN